MYRLKESLTGETAIAYLSLLKYRFAEQNVDVEVNIGAEPELDVLGVPANEDLMKKR